MQRTLAIQNERLVGRQSRGFLADGTARAKPMAVVYLLLEYPNSIRENKQRKNTFLGNAESENDGGLSLIYPIFIPYRSYGEVPMKSR